MTPEQILRLSEIRSRVIRATYEAFREDACHKSSEAACELALCLPNMFDADQRPTWAISIYSYVLGEGQRTFTGRTPDEVLVQAERAVERWCFPQEMKAFEREARAPGEVEGAVRRIVDFTIADARLHDSVDDLSDESTAALMALIAGGDTSNTTTLSGGAIGTPPRTDRGDAPGTNPFPREES